MKLLLERGADIGARNKQKLRALDAAKMNGEVGVRGLGEGGQGGGRTARGVLGGNSPVSNSVAKQRKYIVLLGGGIHAGKGWGFFWGGGATKSIEQSRMKHLCWW